MRRPGTATQQVEFTADLATAVRNREWVARIRTGDEHAFEAMFRAYRDDLVGFVTSMLRSPDLAREVVQDLFLRIWQHRDLWEPNGPLNTYLFRAARNRAIDHIRHDRAELTLRDRAMREGSVTIAQPTSEPADRLVRAADLRDAIARAVDELPDRCREVFRLRRQHHLTNAQVAEVLGISVKTVEVQMTRALGYLRRRLADWHA
jgi:RNA polymerase sigma-70 factor (ECF subfamily)